MIFVSKYLNGVETSLKWPLRNQEDDDLEVDTRIDMFENIVVHWVPNEQLPLVAQS